MLFLFFKSLRYRWFEYVLAVVIVAVIVAAITVQRSLLSYSETQIHDLAHKLGKNMLVVPAKTNLADFYAFKYGTASMPDSYPEKIRNSDVGKHIKFIEETRSDFNKSGKIIAMRLAGCWCSIDVTALATRIESLLPGTRALTVQGMIKAQKGAVAAVKRYSGIIDATAVFLIAGIMMLLISSQVRRQKKEIGFLLAIGTSPWMIIMLFVIKAAIVGALGGVLGYLLGYPITNKIAASLIGTSLPMPEGSLTMVLVLSVMVSVIAAFVPVARAVRTDPTEILREV